MKRVDVARSLAAWVAMLLLSVANGAFRDFSYGRGVTELAAHQISTAIGTVLLGTVAWVFVRRYPPPSARHALSIGVLWAGLTVAFEFLFFHFVAGHPWDVLLANYDVTKGRVWVLVVLWLLVAPYLFFRMRGSA